MRRWPKPANPSYAQMTKTSQPLLRADDQNQPTPPTCRWPKPANPSYTQMTKTSQPLLRADGQNQPTPPTRRWPKPANPSYAQMTKTSQPLLHADGQNQPTPPTRRWPKPANPSYTQMAKTSQPLLRADGQYQPTPPTRRWPKPANPSYAQMAKTSQPLLRADGQNQPTPPTRRWPKPANPSYAQMAKTSQPLLRADGQNQPANSQFVGPSFTTIRSFFYFNHWVQTADLRYSCSFLTDSFVVCQVKSLVTWSWEEWFIPPQNKPRIKWITYTRSRTHRHMYHYHHPVLLSLQKTQNYKRQLKHAAVKQPRQRRIVCQKSHQVALTAAEISSGNESSSSGQDRPVTIVSLRSQRRIRSQVRKSRMCLWNVSQLLH